MQYTNIDLNFFFPDFTEVITVLNVLLVLSFLLLIHLFCLECDISKVDISRK